LIELFLRLLFACFCGGVIGLERSVRRKDAGIKTHIILALGAALFMIVSQYGFGDLNLSPEYRADASRIASNIVTGVSFLCAGVIFVRGASVKGLTTATGIWTCAGIGMAAGAGMYLITILATALILIIQLLLAGPSAKIETHYSIEIDLSLPQSVSVDDIISEISTIIKSTPHAIQLTKRDELNVYKLHFNIRHTVMKKSLFKRSAKKIV
jgi:putative Mg2+ transporter-C (MgtC) family protein